MLEPLIVNYWYECEHLTIKSDFLHEKWYGDVESAVLKMIINFLEDYADNDEHLQQIFSDIIYHKKYGYEVESWVDSENAE